MNNLDNNLFKMLYWGLTSHNYIMILIIVLIMSKLKSLIMNYAIIIFLFGYLTYSYNNRNIVEHKNNSKGPGHKCNRKKDCRSDLICDCNGGAVGDCYDPPEGKCAYAVG